MMNLASCLLTVVATSIAAAFAEDVPPVANIKAGRLVGKTVQSKHLPRQVHAFLGVPYAKPPVGDLRFALPQPTTPWEGIRDATVYAAGCPQDESILAAMIPFQIRETQFSEDCLYLDVYTPDVEGKRSVLFLIHGGGFTVGKSSMNDGSALAAFGDIVVVSISYRLGLLGFLQNNDDYWPQNLGFQDQQFALRWAQNNIAAFGGDPQSITISGESAGSMSTSLHVISPGSRGLFRRVICESGSLFSISGTATADLGALAIQQLGCSDLDADATKACLRNKSVEAFLETGIPGTLVLDGEIYPKDPIKAYLKEDFPNVDMMIGITGNEGHLIAEYFIPAIKEDEIDPDSYKQQMMGYLESNFGYGNNVGEIYEEIMDYYFGGSFTDLGLDFVRQQTTVIVGSQMLVAPTYYNAQVHAERGANTFFYEFMYQPSFQSGMRPSWHTGGCDHALDLTFFLGLPLMLDLLPESLDVTEEDIEMAKIAMMYWINFVKTGNPNGDGLVEWKPFTSEDKDYIIIQPNCQQASDFKPDDMSFWNVKLRAVDVPPEVPREEL